MTTVDLPRKINLRHYLSYNDEYFYYEYDVNEKSILKKYPAIKIKKPTMYSKKVRVNKIENDCDCENQFIYDFVNKNEVDYWAVCCTYDDTIFENSILSEDNGYLIGKFPLKDKSVLQGLAVFLLFLLIVIFIITQLIFS